MLKPAYKIKHVYPTPLICTACDGWGNAVEYTKAEDLLENRGMT